MEYNGDLKSGLLKSGLFEGQILNGPVFKWSGLSYSYSCSPNHSKTGHFCLMFQMVFDKNGGQFQMVGLLDFRSHSKSRLVRISDPHCSSVFKS